MKKLLYTPYSCNLDIFYGNSTRFHLQWFTCNADIIPEWEEVYPKPLTVIASKEKGIAFLLEQGALKMELPAFQLKRFPSNFKGAPYFPNAFLTNSGSLPFFLKGIPTESEGIPFKPEGTPFAPEGVPFAPEGTPTDSEGTPFEPEGTPLGSGGTPFRLKGVPSNSKGVPFFARGSPFIP